MSNYQYNGFNEPQQPEDRITAHLNQVASSQQPQVDPEQEFMQALDNYQSQYGVSQGQSPQMANLSAYDQQKHAAASGDPRAAAALKFADKNIGPNEDLKSNFFDHVHNMPDNVDPANTYQMYNAFAQWSRNNVQMPTPGDISLQDKANIFANKGGSNYAGLQQAAAKNIADINLISGKAAGVGGNSKLPASIQVANEIEKAQSELDAAMSSNDLAAAKRANQRLLDLRQSQKIIKLSEDTYMTPEGVQTANPGAANALGQLKYGANYGGESGTLNADLQLQPTLKGANTAAENKAKIGVEREAGYTKAQSALVGLKQQSQLVNDNIDKAISTISPWSTDYGSVLSVIPHTEARKLNNYLTTIKANIGFDKLQQMRENSPTGGALGQVSDFENKLLQAVNGALDPGESDTLKQNLTIIKELYPRVIQERERAFNQDYGNVSPLGGNPISPGGSSIEETKIIGGKNYHKVNGQWMEE